VKTVTIPDEEYVRDFQRLMTRATSPDECRVLVDMFLGRCGIKFEKNAMAIQESSPSSSTASMEDSDSHENSLVEVLLGEHAEAETGQRPQTPPPEAV